MLPLHVLVLLVVGCSRQPEGAEYFWVSAGARLTYDVKILNPTAGTIEGTMTLREDGTINVAGHTYHKTVTTFQGLPGAGNEVSYTRLAPDGIYSRESPDPSVPETLELPLPPDLGRKWSTTDDDLTMEMEITAIEDCDTVEKTYKKCIEITGNGSKAGIAVKELSYYAPKTGLVKMSLEAAGFLMELTLQSE